jgi:hypothetical protein
MEYRSLHCVLAVLLGIAPLRAVEHLAPHSRMNSLNASVLLRTGKDIAEIVDAGSLNRISDEYIGFLDDLIARKAGAIVKIKLLFHNDADGVVAAKMVQAFFDAYARNTGARIELASEVRAARERDIGDTAGVDAVMAVDLFWSQMVDGIDMAIDHHPLQKNEKKNARENPRLVNLEQVGYKWNIRRDSRFMPASVLSAIVLDHVLRRRGVKRGILAGIEPETLDALLDGGIRGDSSEPSEDSPNKGFRVLNDTVADAIRYVSEIGRDGLELILNAPIRNIVNHYRDIKPISDNKISKLKERFRFLREPFAVGMFFTGSEFSFRAGELEVGVFNEVLSECCKTEKRRDIMDRRVLVFGRIGPGNNNLKVSLRFDGPKDFFDLDDVHERLKNPEPGDRWNPEYFMEGGGPNGAKSIRIPLSMIRGDRETFFNVEMLPAVRETVSRIRTELLRPSPGRAVSRAS